MAEKPRIKVPKEAKKGEVIEIKTLVQHVMETGYRRDANGAVIPRDIIERFVCTYNGEEIFRADLFPAIAANPYIAFTTVATESGTITFSWTDGRGETSAEPASGAPRRRSGTDDRSARDRRGSFRLVIAEQSGSGLIRPRDSFACLKNNANGSPLGCERDPVDRFFDKVLVNAEDARLRANRLALLARLAALMNEVADISRLAA